MSEGEARLLCIGNPLVELHAEVPQALLARYELPRCASVQAEEKHRPLLEELLRGAHKVRKSPGGGAVAAALTAQGLLRVGAAQGAPTGREEARVIFLGGAGHDELSAELRDLLAKEGVEPLLSESDFEMTGWRGALRSERKASKAAATGDEAAGAETAEDAEVPRPEAVSTVTFTGAGREYKLDHLRFKVWESVETAHVVYVESFFLTASAESAKIVAEHCAKLGRHFCLNLSAPYLCRYFYDRILALLPFVDYMFGNEAEYLALAEHSKELAGKSIDAVLSWLSKQPRADGKIGSRRYIVATNGQEPSTVAATWKGYGVKVQRYPVPPIRAGRYVSKDGAGDAFAGGFLYALMCDADLDSCMQMALHAASGCAQRSGMARFAFQDKPQVQRVEQPKA